VHLSGQLQHMLFPVNLLRVLKATTQRDFCGLSKVISQHAFSGGVNTAGRDRTRRALGFLLQAGAPMTIRVAVIGAGYHGQHHARLLSMMPGVELVGVVDTNRTRAAEIAARHGTRAMTDARMILREVDAVTIAVPTEVHHRVAIPFLEAGVGVLVEKPMARSLAEADEMIEAALRTDAPLAVGHSERFNPAIIAVRPLLSKPRFIEVHRLGVFPERSLDIDVVFDVMIHDVDVLLSVVDSEVMSIEATGVPVLTNRIDIANARVRFANGCTANLTASRISRDRVRKLRFFQPSGYFSLDCTAQTVQHWRLVHGNHGAPAVERVEVPVVPDEPLRLELADFVDAIQLGRPPAVTGAHGRRALALAHQITRQIALEQSDLLSAVG
jgi:predicted dehydrogenase